MKGLLLVAAASLLLTACSTEGRIEELQKEVDGLAAKGKYLEAVEAQKEINALRKGEKYIRDEDPEKTAELHYKSNFEYIEITNTTVNYNSITGDLTGQMTNIGSKPLDGYFSVYFFDDDGNIVKNYMTHIPGGWNQSWRNKEFQCFNK
ncbi:hypothetical protein QTG56_25570 (plasmid) [Rossellomorea sp. AcN35-11]|nr:hypothetical protein QTG56_25570 [Rossellomorea sp. AcN35-11]